MAKARILSGGIVERGAGAPDAVVAFVAVGGLPGQGTRLFKLSGSASDPRVDELPPATTIDLGRFDLDARADLEPAAA